MSPTKISVGKWLAAIVLVVATVPADARLSAEVDRREVALGETLRLTLLGDDGEDPDDVDLTALSQNFTLLQRSSSTNASLINGARSVIRTLEIEMEPRREGVLVIPSFAAGGRQTTPIAVTVQPRQAAATNDARVQFSAYVDDDTVYVQEQILLTVTLAQSVNLDARSVSELTIPGAVVEQLEQRAFQRREAGRLWQITELRYVIFPQQSGPLEIPALTFSGREILPGRSMLGARLGNRTLLETKPITITVDPVPASFTGDVWLPAKSLELGDSWSANPDNLKVGDSTTRTIEVNADGLQGSQIPPLSSFGDSNTPDGLRFYPDTETIDDREVSGGIEGYRIQSEALVSTNTGSWTLPAIEVHWWNTQTDRLEVARIAERAVSVRGAQAVQTDLTANTEVAPVESAARLWQGIAAAGWLCAAILGIVLWRQRPMSGVGEKRSASTPRKNLVALRLACQQNDAEGARKAALEWSKDHFGDDAPGTLAALSARCSPAVAEELNSLDRALYSGQGESWKGQTLFAAIRDEKKPGHDTGEANLTLYPS